MDGLSKHHCGPDSAIASYKPKAVAVKEQPESFRPKSFVFFPFRLPRDLPAKAGLFHWGKSCLMTLWSSCLKSERSDWYQAPFSVSSEPPW